MNGRADAELLCLGAALGGAVLAVLGDVVRQLGALDAGAVLHTVAGLALLGGLGGFLVSRVRALWRLRRPG